MNPETKRKMDSGELYFPGDPDILSEQQKHQALLAEYNQTLPSEEERRLDLLQKMLGDCGEGVYIEAPFHANFGGWHCHLGDNVYLNYGCTLVDDTDIWIGSWSMFGPNVTVSTAGHPICPPLRKRGIQYNLPVRIGENCWLGAGVIVLPGVTIGDNTVIGAGSVVTRDIPADCVAAGTPCRIMRPITEEDMRTYHRGERQIDWAEWDR